MLQATPDDIRSVPADRSSVVRFMPHWFMLVRNLLPWFVVLGGCYAALWVLQRQPRSAEVAAQAVPFVLAVLAAGFAYALLKTFVAWRFSVLSVFADRIEYRTGMLTTRTSTVQIAEVANQDIRQTLLQRLLGFGDLYIDSRASAILAVYAVSNVRDLQDLIWSRRDQVTQQTGFRSSGGH
jgi:uncharacterized membrane protein YdbT with pleckstrin-like domain